MGVTISKADFWAGDSVLHPLVVGSITIVCLYVYLRLASPRALAQVSAFDVIANISIGSTLSRIITQPSLDLTRGLISLATIIIWTQLADTLAVSHGFFENMFRCTPILFVFRGEMLHKTMFRHRTTAHTIQGALRQHGVYDIAEVEAVVLEMSGAFSVIRRSSVKDDDAPSTLDGVPGYKEQKKAWMDRQNGGRLTNGANNEMSQV